MKTSSIGSPSDAAALCTVLDECWEWMETKRERVAPQGRRSIARFQIAVATAKEAIEELCGQEQVAAEAALPELLAALRGVMRFALPITADDVRDFEAARAAIAKAEGPTT